MTNFNKYGVHEVGVGSKVKVWRGKTGTVTNIRILGGKISLQIDYVSDKSPKKVTTLCTLAEEIDEFTAE